MERLHAVGAGTITITCTDLDFQKTLCAVQSFTYECGVFAASFSAPKFNITVFGTDLHGTEMFHITLCGPITTRKSLVIDGEYTYEFLYTPPKDLAPWARICYGNYVLETSLIYPHMRPIEVLPGITVSVDPFRGIKATGLEPDYIVLQRSETEEGGGSHFCNWAVLSPAAGAVVTSNSFVSTSACLLAVKKLTVPGDKYQCFVEGNAPVTWYPPGNLHFSQVYNPYDKLKFSKDDFCNQKHLDTPDPPLYFENWRRRTAPTVQHALEWFSNSSEGLKHRSPLYDFLTPTDRAQFVRTFVNAGMANYACCHISSHLASDEDARREYYRLRLRTIAPGTDLNKNRRLPFKLEYVIYAFDMHNPNASLITPDVIPRHNRSVLSRNTRISILCALFNVSLHAEILRAWVKYFCVTLDEFLDALTRTSGRLTNEQLECIFTCAPCRQ